MQNNIYDVLVDSRIIFINGIINEDLATNVVSKLLYLDSINNNDINIYINSNGGSVSDGLAIIDTMKLVKSKVNTIGYGNVSSMAAVILANGDKRYCLRHTRCMIHQVYGGMQGRADDIEVSYNNMLEVKKDVTSVLADRVKKSIEEVEKDCEKDYWMSSEQALEYGLIDEVL